GIPSPAVGPRTRRYKCRPTPHLPCGREPAPAADRSGVLRALLRRVRGGGPRHPSATAPTAVPDRPRRRGAAAIVRGPARRARSRRGDGSGVDSGASEVPDVLAPGLRVVFCGINPGRVSAAAAAHFANPRNDFWRLLHAAGFTPRLLSPQEQFEALEHGIGITNAAHRTTRGSGDLRRADFAGSAARLE